MIDDERMVPGRAVHRQCHCSAAVESPRVSPLTSDAMTKHSKNNTASSIFSYAERKKLEYGTKGVGTLAALVSFRFDNHRFCRNGSAMSLCGDLMLAPCVYNERVIR
jgi:hypothetical protein